MPAVAELAEERDDFDRLEKTYLSGFSRALNFALMRALESA